MASLEEERRLNALTFDGLPHTHTMESFPIELQDLPRPQSDLEAGKMYWVPTFSSAGKSALTRGHFFKSA